MPRYGPDHHAAEASSRIPDRVRRAVLDRDQGQCQACGTAGENRLQMHHVEYRSQGGGHIEANLVLLCMRCHRDVHEDRLDVQLIEWKPGRWAVFCHRKMYWRTVR